ncbi:acetylxylan esterase [Curtobacterium citreum]|uniref:Acetylxylan esterase n=1 Tax=Curtobacterium citreum TaxID=2036 RepID=A0ABT2HEL3_9MICO|nr:acetylxylan esterase [Curtobacterium citreum]MCS6521703.1 acetylxylan esterase [Curtobacterium citreum]TQJ27092.1 cephalosporin-C deacetylase [Curtobacterium citreum]GGL74047.1 acetylxylan esterase [Curtobacterium citreum]
MPLTDLPLDQLRAYRPEVRRPADLDAFWADTIAEARAAGAGTAPVTTPAETPVTALDVQDLTFPGFGGDPVRAWVSRPAGTADQDLPVVVEFLGYGGGRGLPGERVSWALAGFVHVVMDTRGQGSGWGSGGDTPDPHGSVPHVGGWMASGVDAPANHYYRRVFTDAVRLVEAVRTLPGVDVDRIALTGGSQGGGITLAAAALVEAHVGPLVAVLPDVAFLCDWEHGTAVAVGGPYLELATHLSVHRDDVDRVWDTVAYFDGVHFAERISAPALFSVALMDDVVPPRTTFAAYNALGSADREIAVYPYNGHEGGGFRHWERQVAFLRDRL